jgi:hypothetical protein
MSQATHAAGNSIPSTIWAASQLRGMLNAGADHLSVACDMAI